MICKNGLTFCCRRHENWVICRVRAVVDDPRGCEVGGIQKPVLFVDRVSFRTKCLRAVRFVHIEKRSHMFKVEMHASAFQSSRGTVLLADIRIALFRGTNV